MMPQRATTVWIELEGKAHKVVLGGGPDTPVIVDGKPFSVDARELSQGVLSLLLTLPDGMTRSFRCVSDPGADPAVDIQGQHFAYAVADPRSLRAVGDAAGGDSGPRPLKSPMPGRVLRLLVAQGDVVQAGQSCVVIEAMKMQNELKAPRAGRVTRLTATEGETVVSGAVLLVIE